MLRDKTMSQIEMEIKRSLAEVDSILFKAPLALNVTQPNRSNSRTSFVPDQVAKISPEAQFVLKSKSDDLVTRVVREVLWKSSQHRKIQHALA